MTPVLLALACPPWLAYPRLLGVFIVLGGTSWVGRLYTLACSRTRDLPLHELPPSHAQYSTQAQQKTPWEVSSTTVFLCAAIGFTLPQKRQLENGHW